MLKKIKYFVIILFIPLLLNANEELEIWFTDMSDDFIQIIEMTDKSNLQKNLSFLIEEKFAVNSISMGLIGKISKKTNQEDLDKYKKAFLTHLTKSLYNLIERYDGQVVKLEKIEKDVNGFLIYSKLEYGNKSYSIVWRVAHINNKPKVLDVIIENTSYYVTKKSEFSKILRDNKGKLSQLTEIIKKVTLN
jgi:ABC-type transporter MlaC component